MKILNLPSMTTLQAPELGIDEATEIQKIARKNGYRVINRALDIERDIQHIIEKFLFPEDLNLMGSFQSTIGNAEWFGFNNKWRVLRDITSEMDTLQPAERKSILQDVKKIIEWRNAFAHGQLITQAKKVILEHRTRNESNGIVLSDEFWETVEQTFISLQKRLTRLINSMENQDTKD